MAIVTSVMFVFSLVRKAFAWTRDVLYVLFEITSFLAGKTYKAGKGWLAAVPGSIAGIITEAERLRSVYLAIVSGSASATVVAALALFGLDVNPASVVLVFGIVQHAVAAVVYVVDIFRRKAQGKSLVSTISSIGPAVTGLKWPGIDATGTVSTLDPGNFPGVLDAGRLEPRP